MSHVYTELSGESVLYLTENGPIRFIGENEQTVFVLDWRALQRMRPGSVRRLASAAGRKSAKTSSERCDIVASSWTCLDLVEPALRYRGRAEICPGDSPRHGGDRICVPSDGQSMADGVFEGMRRLDEAIDGG